MIRARLRACAAIALVCGVPLAAQGVSDPLATSEAPAPSTPAASVTPPSAERASCEAKLFGQKEGGAGALFLLCKGQSLRLGSALGFSTSYNPTLDRYLVVSRLEAGERVYMIRPPRGEQAGLVEDVTNDLAAAARGLRVVQVRALIGGVDAKDFATTGTVRLTGAASNMPVARDAQPIEVRVAGESGFVGVVNPEQAKPLAKMAPPAGTPQPNAAPFKVED